MTAPTRTLLTALHTAQTAARRHARAAADRRSAQRPLDDGRDQWATVLPQVPPTSLGR